MQLSEVKDSWKEVCWNDVLYDLAEAAKDFPEAFTAWEHTFISDVEHRHHLTDRQVMKIAEIAARIGWLMEVRE